MIYFLLVVIFIIISGIIAASETALLVAPKSIIRDKAEQKSFRAKIVQAFQKDPERIIATANVGFIVSLSISAFLSGLFALEVISPIFRESQIQFISNNRNLISVIIVVPVLSFVAIVLGELVPKSLALKMPVPFALAAAVPFHWLSYILNPIIILLRGLSNIFLKPFKDQTSFSEARVSEDEFKILLEEGRKSGTIDKTEQELITSIFEFTDTTAKEVMIPRTDVIAISIDTPRETLINIVMEEGYSRLPVFSGNIDNIIGIIYTKDLISLLEHRDIIILQDIIRHAYFIPEGIKISTLMRDMQKQKIHMAIVVDEFGGTEGIITMEDILEEIVGEIHDEYDEEIKEIETSTDGLVIVNARINITEFNEKFHSEIPEESDYDTIGGFLNKITGHIPELNEIINYKGLQFFILKKGQRRIRQVTVRGKFNPEE